MQKSNSAYAVECDFVSTYNYFNIVFYNDICDWSALLYGQKSGHNLKNLGKTGLQIPVGLDKVSNTFLYKAFPPKHCLNVKHVLSM